MTKQEMPKGGVNTISAPTTVTMPNHTRLMCRGSRAGRNSGTTIRMIDAVSKIVPSANSSSTYRIMKPANDMWTPASHSPNRVGKPAMPSSRV